MFNKFRYLLLLLLICCPLPRSLWGQAPNTGTVSGNIADTSGAVVPNADVTLTSLSTGQITHVTSNDRGEYLLNDVHVGLYRMHVTAPSFGAVTIDNAEVDADQNVRLDVQLKPGTVEASVVVEDAGVSIDTRSATIGTLIDQKLIDNLPIDSNNVVALAGLLPGVVNVNSPTTFTGDTNGPTYNASGSRSNQNLMLLDGMMWNNVFYNTGLNFPPSQALQEVSVLLSNYKAQYGRNAGSVFNVITRSGSNQFHGALWEFLQNRAFNASDRLSHVNPKLVQNQFGGTIGGRILRNRAFFFASFQDLRVAQQVTAQDFLLTSLERGNNPDGTAYKCNSAGPFAGDTCASFKEDAEAQYTTATPPTTTDPDNSKYLYNPLYTVPGTATSAFNAAWSQAGNTGASPCVTVLQNAKATHGQYLPYAELPSECFNPVAVAFEQKYVPYRMVFNSDVTNTVNEYSPYNTSPTQPYGPSVINGSVAEAAGAQCHMFAPAFCWVPWWPSTVYPLQTHVDWVKSRYGASSVFDPITQWVLQGNDLIQQYITACRSNNVAAFVSFRMNDSQACENSQSSSPLPEWQSIGFNRLYAEHPEYCLGTDLSVYAQAAQDWSIQAVRDYKFALIQELCTNYDLDGIELDFMRQMYYFNQTTTTLNQRQSIISAFIASVRAVFNARTDRYRYLSLRVPCDPAVCDQIGINLAALAGLGVDMITVSPSYYTLQASAFAAIKAAVGSMPANLEMTNNDQGGYQASGAATYRRTTYEQLYTTAHVGFGNGATGMSLFNFAYYRNNVYQLGNDGPYTPPPFDAMAIMQNPTSVATQPQHYFNAGGAGVMTSPEIPVNVYGGTRTFNLDFTLRAPSGGWVNGGRFRLKCLDTAKGITPYTFTGSTWQIYLTNSVYTNVLLTQTTDTSEPYTTAWTQDYGTSDQRLAWIVPANLLQNGTNTFICKKLTGAAYLRIGYADLGVS